MPVQEDCTACGGSGTIVVDGGRRIICNCGS